MKQLSPFVQKPVMPWLKTFPELVSRDSGDCKSIIMYISFSVSPNPADPFLKIYVHGFTRIGL
jgi:hypothetical protein